MRSLLVLVLAVAAHAAPQGIQLTQKEHAGLLQALDGRIPIAIQSGNQVFAMVEESPSEFVVLNLPGLGPADEFAARTGAAAEEEEAPASVEPTSDDVAELFREVAEDAVEDVVEAAEESADIDIENPPAVMARSLSAANLSSNDILTIPTADALSTESETLVTKEIEAIIKSASPEAETEVGNIAAMAQDETKKDAALKSKVMAKGEAASIPVVTEPVTATLAKAGTETNVRDATTTEAVETAVTAALTVRRKRQDEFSNLDELSFGLAGLGSLIGSNVGRWLDATFNANVDLIHGFENTGLLVLDQVEDRFETSKGDSSSSSSSSGSGSFLF